MSDTMAALGFHTISIVQLYNLIQLCLLQQNQDSCSNICIQHVAGIFNLTNAQFHKMTCYSTNAVQPPQNIFYLCMDVAYTMSMSSTSVFVCMRAHCIHVTTTHSPYRPYRCQLTQYSSHYWYRSFRNSNPSIASCAALYYDISTGQEAFTLQTSTISRKTI